MTNLKTTKKALLSSVIALFLCFSMLLGTTFAWFTDSVTSAGNVIQTGTLDVSLEHADTVLGVDDAGWTDASTGAIFNYSNWEPGYTAVKYVKIENEGTLDLKFILNIIPNNEAEEVNLADVIEVYMVSGAVNVERTALTTDSAAYVGTLTSLIHENDGAAHGVLYADAAKGNVYEIYTIALKMSTSAGNEYMGKSVGGGFSVQLLTTQLASESDSLNNKYDENAWNEVAEVPTPDANGVVNVYTAKQLAGVMANTAGIKTINIIEDIDLGGRTWVPAYVSAPNLVINGNGHTISGMTVNGKANQGFIGVAYQDITITDLTFKNAKVNSTGSFVGGVIGWAWGNADVTFNNVDVIDSEVSATIGNKSIRVGGLIGFYPFDGGNLTLKDCDVSGSTITGYHNVGAMVGTTLTQKTVNVENCTAKNNTLKYGSPNVGAFDFGAYTSGYIAYVPATGFTAENNKLVAIVSGADALNKAIENGATYVELSAGEYTISGNNNVVIVGSGAETVIDITSNIQNVNISNATVIGDTSLNVNDANTAIFNNVVFNGNVGIVEQGVVNGDTTFVDCTFNSGLHINSSVNTATVEFDGCTFGEYGYIKLGGKAKYVMNDCTVEALASDATGPWGSEWLIAYSDVTFSSCTIGRVLRAGGALTFTLLNCVDAEGNPVTQDIVHDNSNPTVDIK